MRSEQSRASKRMSEWPSTLVCILGCFGPQCRAEKENVKRESIISLNWPSHNRQNLHKIHMLGTGPFACRPAYSLAPLTHSLSHHCSLNWFTCLFAHSLILELMESFWPHNKCVDFMQFRSSEFWVEWATLIFFKNFSKIVNFYFDYFLFAVYMLLWT